MPVESDGSTVLVRFGGADIELTRTEAATLVQQLSDALCERREFFRTAGEHRTDGSYVVSRRGAQSSGHRKVFESFGHLRRLYERLPAVFTAEAVGRTGLTGGRRHMLVRHFAEHPAFDCDLVSRQPLTVRKRPSNQDVVDEDAGEVAQPAD